MKAQRGRPGSNRQTTRPPRQAGFDEEDEGSSDEDRRRLVNKARAGTGMDPVYSRKTQKKLSEQEEELRALQDQLKGLEGTLGGDLAGVMSQLNDLKGQTKAMEQATTGLQRQAQGASGRKTRQESELLPAEDSDEDE